MKDKSKELYKQCKISGGKYSWTAWLPINLAVEGKTVVPKGADPAIVKEVYHSIALTHKQLIEYYEKHREEYWDF